MDALEARHASGALGFLDLPGRTDLLAAVEAWADRADEVDDIVLVGIGGSALSARVFAALRPEPLARPRLHVLDTVDPQAVTTVLEHIDPARTLVLGVSKSGTTLETASVLPLFEARLSRALGPRAAAHIVMITGVEPGPLRQRAAQGAITCLDIPAEVGGRFSALTAVGLLPAALLGVDPGRILAGAARAREAVFGRDPATNPALALAGLHASAQAAGLHTAVIWPYGEALSTLGPWCAQLVSESIGQRRLEDGEPVGVAAFPARGPADQHSLLQLLLDGPPGRLAVFVSAPTAGSGPDVTVDGRTHALGDVLDAEREGTASALASRDRPSLSIRLADTSPEAVGAFLFVYEAAVALWGLGLGIDPFLQPAVGLGKRAAMARLAGTPLDDPRADDLGTARAAGPRHRSRLP